ncbi:hypothetical protein EYF80_061861 [Liparis tanakae]|uniref:Uncharacterized protein n=1 Tax=Liparis tanakae TaxID=230148 RepID=A0A4Z2EHF3_9TELE|nr:hypothetical protein EYF80_061861 [Liparis tanakae]
MDGGKKEQYPPPPVGGVCTPQTIKQNVRALHGSSGVGTPHKQNHQRGRTGSRTLDPLEREELPVV